MVTVTAPASTANLGPGFDCLGAAVTRALTVTASSDGGGPQAQGLVVKGAALVLGEAPNLTYEITGGFPSGRGLGFSAAEVAAGLLIGCALAGKELGPAKLLDLGTPLEGHPDNLAATLYGGVTLAEPNGSVLRFEPAASVRPLIFVPHEQLPTKKARGVLPDDVPRADAVSNIARSSGLIALLSGAVDPTRERLLECTDDRLHQPYRMDLMPRTAELIRDLRASGIAAAVSGAGPSVVCLVLRGEEDAVSDVGRGREGWELLDVDWDLEGARIIKR